MTGWNGFLVRLAAGAGITIDQSDPGYPTISASGGGGGIESIVAGQNILVDASDPAHPIVALGSETLPVIEVVGSPTDLIAAITAGGAQLLMAGGAVSIASPSAPFTITSTFPVRAPKNPDVITNLDPTNSDYLGAFIYDEATNTLMYSNGTAWVSLT